MSEVSTSPAPDNGDSGRRAELSARARQLPDEPGVYLFKDGSGEVLYVGKASSLRHRVGSYFTNSTDLGPRKQPMLDRIDQIEVIEAQGDWEALLMEARLIKDIRPRYNILLKDDKSYPYLVVTTRDTFPGVYVTRTPQDSAFKGGRVFGPFSSSGSLREAVQVMQRIFRFRTCHLEIEEGAEANRHFRPCLLHAIEMCSAPCADRIDSKSYRTDVDRLVRFMGSQRRSVLKELREAMEEASNGNATTVRNAIDLERREREREIKAAVNHASGVVSDQSMRSIESERQERHQCIEAEREAWRSAVEAFPTLRHAS